MPLTDLACLHAKPHAKVYRLTDGDGLYLEVIPKGYKYWRLRYFFHGKEKILAIGVYPKISLLDARKARDEAQKQILQGIDPLLAKRESKRTKKYQDEQTFEVVTRDWHKHFLDTWEPKTAYITLRRFELYLFPSLGRYPAKDVTDQMMLDALRKVEKKSHDVAHRLLKHTNWIYEYFGLTRGIKHNPTIGLIKHLKKYRRENYASIKIDELPELLKAIDSNKERLYRQTILAIRLLMLTAVRTTELREATWNEINFETATWTIPAHRMKMKLEHLVPLSKQAIKILLELKQMNGAEKYVFAGQYSKKKPMSQSTIIQALRRLGYKGKMTGHGFRALFMGISKEKLKVAHDIPDRQLAHVPSGKNGKAYDRAEFIDERRKLMQKYADYIDNPTHERKTDAIYTNSFQQQPYTYTFTQNQSRGNTNYNGLGQAGFISQSEKRLIS